MVILADAASQREQLLDISNEVSELIIREVKPSERWGVFPYFNFRSESEQANLNQTTVA